ncbi:snurportin-1 [Cimex lectularius]|uniref:Snurportin-1 n=1 Tax=Cimex lectularius TaxID=79782 RepID=A0A8I6RBY9_CIMLE|nr:snurportin-1 [Cimex lectularius]
MEELVEGLTVASVSLEYDDVSLVHPRYDQYKQKKSRVSQEERRKQFLLDQKNKRLECFNRNRGIPEEPEDESVQIKPHDEKSVYANWLMLSVWLVDVPENMKEEWYYVICPQGKRTLVIAERGVTRAYSRHGELLMKFPSHLPGGRKEHNGYTVLDCIWDHFSKTYFILDILTWAVPLTNCEAELRFFWLKNKYAEIPELSIPGKTNRHRFILLDHNYVSDLQKNMETHPFFSSNEPKVDGVIFYHKDSLYTPGKSPLVTWLKPFMLPDILGTKVAEAYHAEIPMSYQKRRARMDVDETDAGADAKYKMATETA